MGRRKANRALNGIITYIWILYIIQDIQNQILNYLEI